MPLSLVQPLCHAVSRKGRPISNRICTVLSTCTHGQFCVSSGLYTVEDYERGVDEYNLNSPPRQKRMRTSFKHHQLRTMKAYFGLNHNPDAKDLKQLAEKTGLSKRVLQVRIICRPTCRPLPRSRTAADCSVALSDWLPLCSQNETSPKSHHHPGLMMNSVCANFCSSPLFKCTCNQKMSKVLYIHKSINRHAEQKN